MDLVQLSLENRDDFIAQSKAFIYTTTYNICKRKLYFENDDELSISLMAFNNACNTYKADKGNFYSYARVLIKNALIDYFRKSSKVPYVIFDENDETMDFIDYKSSISKFNIDSENNRRAEEIALFSKELLEYKLDFGSLIKASPSHKDTRDSLLNLAFKCIQEQSILDYIKHKRLLPVKEIILLTGNNRKLIEKWRKYILILILILSSNEYPYIKSYLNIKVGDRNEK
jgi:RNA polymerase sigma factor